MKMKGWIILGTIGALTLTCAAMRPRAVSLNDPQSSEATSGKTADADLVITQSDDTSVAETQLEAAGTLFAQSSANGTAGSPEGQAEALTTYSGMLQSFGHGDHGTSRALVIRSSETDPKEQSGIEEDLAVMSHILDKTLDEKFGNQSHGRKAMGIDLWFASSSNPFSSLYLDGYGALFMLKVGFPLLPPAKNESRKEKTETSSTWEEARQELYGHPNSGKAATLPAEEYDQAKVNALRDSLFEALKNASNIHDLKPDDSVTLCIFGGAGGTGKASSVVRRGASTGELQNRLWVFNGGAGNQARGTIMTIRVKKSDVDALAKGKLDSDEFRKKAKVTTYLGSAESGTGVMSFGGGSGVGGGNYQLWQTR